MTCIALYFIVFSRSCSSQSLQGSVFLSLCLSSYSLSMSDPRDRLLAHKYKQKQDRKEREEREKRDSILNEAIPDSYLKPRDVAVQGKTLTGSSAGELTQESGPEAEARPPPSPYSQTSKETKKDKAAAE